MKSSKHPLGTDSDANSRSTILRLGVTIDGCSEYIVTYDLVGMSLFFYSDVTKQYDELSPEKLDTLSLQDCTNFDEVSDHTFPGGYTLSEYKEKEYYNLGWASFLAQNPEYGEYFNSPGLLSLVIAYGAHRPHIQENRKKRLDLVQTLLDSAHISKYQLGWLNKVRPGDQSPLRIARLVTASLLSRELSSAYSSSGNYNRKLKKAVAHQRRWTTDGMQLLCSIITKQRVIPDQFSSLLTRYNVCGEDKGVLSTLAYAMIDDLCRSDDIPPKIRSRIRRFKHDPLHESGVDTFEVIKAVDEYAFGDSLMTEFDITKFFIKDDDIPPPVIAGDDNIVNLDSLNAIQEQAKKAKNCLWSDPIVYKVINGTIDLYKFEGISLYTISVDRRKNSIERIEAPNYGPIILADMVKIIEWFQSNGTHHPESIFTANLTSSICK